MGIATLLADLTASSGAATVVGGGDSVAAIEQMNFADKVTHVSTGAYSIHTRLAPQRMKGVDRNGMVYPADLRVSCTARYVGGGATLELLGGAVLPGVAAIQDA